MASSPDVHACFVRQAYRFAFGRKESDAEACALSTWTQRFDEHGTNLAELMLDLVTTLAKSPRRATTPDP